MAHLLRRFVTLFVELPVYVARELEEVLILTVIIIVLLLADRLVFGRLGRS